MGRKDRFLPREDRSLIARKRVAAKRHREKPKVFPLGNERR